MGNHRPSRRGDIKFGGPRTVPVRSGPDGSRGFWGIAYPRLFLRAANPDRSPSGPNLDAALDPSSRAKAPANGRFNGLLSSLKSAFCNLRLAVPTTSDSRSSGFPTPYYWLGTPGGLATHWRDYPYRIPCTSLVHMEILAIYWLGNSLMAFRPIRHQCASLPVHSLPTILLLAGNDEYPRSGPGLAIPSPVEVGDIAPPIHRRRQQPEVGDVPALASASAARFLAKDHYVLVQFPRNPHPQAHARLGLLGDQFTDGAESKHHPSGRLQGLRQIHSRPHRVDGSVQLLAGQGSILAQPRITHHLSPREDPAMALFLAQLSAIALRVAPEGPAHELARRGDGVTRAYELSERQAVPRLERDYLPALARFRNIQDLHRLL